MMAQISVTHRFPAAPEHVFDAWLDPAVARRFLFATHDDEMTCAEIEPGAKCQHQAEHKTPLGVTFNHTATCDIQKRTKAIDYCSFVPHIRPSCRRHDLRRDKINRTDFLIRLS